MVLFPLQLCTISYWAMGKFFVIFDPPTNTVLYKLVITVNYRPQSGERDTFFSLLQRPYELTLCSNYNSSISGPEATNKFKIYGCL